MRSGYGGERRRALRPIGTMQAEPPGVLEPGRARCGAVPPTSLRLCGQAAGRTAGRTANRQPPVQSGSAYQAAPLTGSTSRSARKGLNCPRPEEGSAPRSTPRQTSAPSPPSSFPICASSSVAQSRCPSRWTGPLSPAVLPPPCPAPLSVRPELVIEMLLCGAMVEPRRRPGRCGPGEDLGHELRTSRTQPTR